MPWWNPFSSNEQDSGEERGYGDLSDVELTLLDEADAAQSGEQLDESTFYHAVPSEGAVYISQAEGDDYNCTFSYSGTDESAIIAEGNSTLLSHLNGSWRG